ncbi:MAG TPA: 3-deoxy-manno-octulosonate cytidylyltransferase [Thermoanaerobaculia bacterium]|nr:3-deoxy-manno-octulosonate cytidylyltransferase [Thermoanaerobaculia bacterium]
MPAGKPDDRIAVVGAIPARYASTRLPGKALLPLLGRPLIEHVYRRVSRVESLSDVVVLTDDERIVAAVEGFGGRCELTPPECRSGTDRVAWAARRWSAAAVVNVQGDEPLVDCVELAAMVRHLIAHPEDPVVTLATDCPDDLFEDPDAVKVVVSRAGYALYFSRAPVPFPRHPGHARPRLHVGVYGYQRQALLELAAIEPTPLELAESLEQLRALESGYPIRVLPSAKPSVGVDTPADLERVERMMRSMEQSE